VITSEEIRLGRFQEAIRIAEMSRLLIETGLGWSWTPERVIREIRSKHSNVVVATEDSRIVGFAIMSYGDVEASLNLFAVDPEHRRKGIGTRLIQWLEKTALVNGNGRVCLEVRSINREAIKFYESMGYSVIQRIPGYYRGRETAVRMAHDLWTGQSQ
jgi:ribosomal-protein-alanine N-acetyltransferase